MSHEIVKHKFLATYTDLTPRRNWRTLESTLLYIVFWSSNNVSPRTYDGQVLATDYSHSDPNASRWNGNIMLPKTLWECAHSADGGMIKTYPGKDITGTAWIKSWKETAERPIPLAREDGTLLVIPRCSIYLPKDTYNLEKRPEFPSHLADELNAAWDALVVPLLSGPAYYRLDPTVRTTTALSQFLMLEGWARKLQNHSFFVGWDESAAGSFSRLLCDVPESKAKSYPKFEPGMIIELYNHRYTLTEKRKSSWIGEKDGRRFCIGPKPLQSAKIIAHAA